MTRILSRTIATALVCVLVVSGCRKERSEVPNEAPAFSFTVYPGSRYLAQLTELTKQAHRVTKPNEEPPATAIYDTDAPLDQVAEYYIKAYGYATIAPDATNNLSVTRPPAYYRSGDLNVDQKSVIPFLKPLHLQTDITKAQGKYKAVEIDAKPERPHVTLQRPYFDVSTSQVVDRTLILMARQ